MTIADRKPIKGADAGARATHDLPAAGLWEENGYSIAHCQLVLSVPEPALLQWRVEMRARKGAAVAWGGRSDEGRSPSGGISAYRAQEMVSDRQH